NNPGPGTPPEDADGDLDGDGRPDSKDWIPYDPRVDAWDATGTPRFAVIETGDFIPWRSNKHGMVLGYIGAQPTVHAQWYVWYQGEWQDNKLDIQSLDASGIVLDTLPILSQEHPLVHGTATGTRPIGCDEEDLSVIL